MNILLNLKINQRDCLQFITDIEDNDFINLNNTFISVWLKQSKKKLCICKVSVGFELYDFAERIQKCLNNQIGTPTTFGKNVDLGLLWNEHWQKLSLAEKTGNTFKSWDWLADNTIFLQSSANGKHSCNTFLYNDDNGNIIFETSAAYPWFFKNAQSPELNISYDNWLPKYKILYKTIISRKIAQEWFIKLNDLYTKLESNMPSSKK